MFSTKPQMDAERWKQIDALLDAVFQLEPDKREAFLNQVCAGDESLRKELITFIAADERAGNFLKDPALEGTRPATSHPGVASGTLLRERYEIMEQIGAGGMGEVYRGRDRVLSRDVAIKVLPPSFATDSKRLRRFEQEARAAGSLNHPHILSIFDLGTDEGCPFLVSELLEGETLRTRLQNNPLPVRKVLEYALQIAHGLAAAHERGIVHRDLKPENIFITKVGRVKILDFGVAKLMDSRVSTSQFTNDSTAAPQTENGVILGTVVYMSPEQVRGERVDHRSDLFAFGGILYEMLSGKRPFQGSSSVEVMHAILKEEPQELGELNSTIPPALERIIKRCLEKTPEQRFQSASDLAFALESLSITTQVSGAARPLRGSRSFARISHLVITSLSIVAAVYFGIRYFHRPAPHVVNSSISSPGNALFETSFSGIALSPDGRKLAFVAINGKREIWIRSLESEIPIKLLDTTEGYSPFWSPDGRSIAFFTKNKLKKIDISTGVVQSICDAPDGRGGTWNQDGTIVFAPYSGGPLCRVSAAGGTVTPITTLRKNETGHKWPSFLPDGKHFLYVAQSAERTKKGSVFVGSLDSKSDKLLMEDASNAMYASPGYLLFARGFWDATLFAQPFHAERLQLEGKPITIAQKISFNYLGSIAPYSVSNNGLLIYQRDVLIPSQLVWLDRSCNNIGSIEPPSIYDSPRISPDAKKIIVNRTDQQNEQSDVWIYHMHQKRFTRFTTDGALKQRVIWSPDGSQIVYGSEQNGKADLYQKSSSGGLKASLLFQSERFASPIDWSSDGRFIVFNSQDPVSKMDLWVLPLTGDRKPFPFVQDPSFDIDGYFSPDGRWIAYTSNASGEGLEIYVRPFPISAGQWQVSSSGGFYPRWRTDGKELFYLSPNNELMSVEIKPGVDFQAGTPKVLGVLPELIDQETGYDVASNGQRFLFDAFTRKEASTPLTIVFNWQAELKK